MNGTLFVVLVSIVIIFVVILAFELYSHMVYHRSVMATFVESFFRMYKFKNHFLKGDGFDDFAKSVKHHKKYNIGAEKIVIRSKIKKLTTDGQLVYTLSNKKKSSKAILYFHGGSFVEEILVAHWEFCDKLSKKTGFDVVVPIYKLAPEGNAKDAIDSFEKLYLKMKFKYDEIVIMGDSAGGGMALSLALKLKTKTERKPKIILISPWVDVTMSNPEIEKYEKVDPLLSAYGLAEFGKWWASGLKLTDYRVSPIYADLSSLDEVYIFVGNREILYPDAKQLFSKLEIAGVKVKIFEKTGMNHAYVLYPIPEAKKAFNKIIKILK